MDEFMHKFIVATIRIIYITQKEFQLKVISSALKLV